MLSLLLVHITAENNSHSVTKQNWTDLEFNHAVVYNTLQSNVVHPSIYHRSYSSIGDHGGGWSWFQTSGERWCTPWTGHQSTAGLQQSRLEQSTVQVSTVQYITEQYNTTVGDTFGYLVLIYKIRWKFWCNNEVMNMIQWNAIQYTHWITYSLLSFCESCTILLSN